MSVISVGCIKFPVARITEFFVTYDHTFANIYPVGDAFRYLVEWMSDNQMTCSSLLFDTGGDLYGTIVTGKELSTSVSASPEISFYDLFTEMNKLFNIAMYVDLCRDLTLSITLSKKKT